MLIDIHTHHLAEGNPRSISIYNLKPQEWPEIGSLASAGLHPWEANKEAEERLAQILPAMAAPQTIAIGEIGLDKRRKGDDMARQTYIFEQQIAYANRIAKPIIVHCVGAWDELMRLKSTMRTPAIVHGFRGKPQLMAMLCKAGFYLSFGEKANESSLREMPIERLFLETDDSPTPLAEIYRTAALAKGINPDELETAIERNFSSVFGFRAARPDLR